MPISLEWYDDERTILRHVYTGNWTWEEYQGTFEVMNTMSTSVQHPVYHVIDMTQTRMMPQGSSIAQIRTGARYVPPNAAAMIVAGNSLFLTIISKMIAAVPRSSPTTTGRNIFRMVKNLDEAMQFIQEHKKQRASS
jgi:hypothetical protein